MPNPFLLLLFTALSACTDASGARRASDYIRPSGQRLAERILPPAGYTRANATEGSWAQFLRELPLLPDGSPVLDYTGAKIANQSSHAAVIAYDVGRKDLQQCADAIIRLRAEYLYAQERYADITFQFTSGHSYAWLDHARGLRPIPDGHSVRFARKAKEDYSYANFQRYLEWVFIYAGTISLHREMKPAQRNAGYRTGDVIVHAGSPGHAVLIADKAVNAQGEAVYLLVQGFTPAQSIHLMNSGMPGISPWYQLPASGHFASGRYYFTNPVLRRFE